MSYCYSRLAKRRILYTDSIEGGQQAARDDLWAVTSDELNQAADVHRRLWDALVLIESIASGSTTVNSLPHIAKIAVAAFTGEHVAPVPPKTWQERCEWHSEEPAVGLMHRAMKEEIAELRAALASGFREGRSTSSESVSEFIAAEGATHADSDKFNNIWNDALEEAALICDQQAQEPECPERASYCADEIRALKHIDGDKQGAQGGGNA